MVTEIAGLVLQRRATRPGDTNGCVRATPPRKRYAGDRRSRAGNIDRRRGGQRLGDLDHSLARFSNGDGFGRGTSQRIARRQCPPGKRHAGDRCSRARNIGRHLGSQRVGDLDHCNE